MRIILTRVIWWRIPRSLKVPLKSKTFTFGTVFKTTSHLHGVSNRQEILFKKKQNVNRNWINDLTSIKLTLILWPSVPRYIIVLIKILKKNLKSSKWTIPFLNLESLPQEEAVEIKNTRLHKVQSNQLPLRPYPVVTYLMKNRSTYHKDGEKRKVPR